MAFKFSVMINNLNIITLIDHVFVLRVMISIKYFFLVFSQCNNATVYFNETNFFLHFINAILRKFRHFMATQYLTP